LSGILNIRNHNVSEAGSVSILRRREGDTYYVGSLSHWLAVYKGLYRDTYSVGSLNHWLAVSKVLYRVGVSLLS
jgi:hypothetical protein